MGQDICIRKDEKPLGYDWECGHEELYVRVNMYYNGSLYVGLWQKQKECEKKLELFGDLTIGVMGFLRPGQAIISDCGAKAKVDFGRIPVEKRRLIDFIFIKGAVEVERYRTIDDKPDNGYLSDHAPVMAILKL